MTRTLAPRDPTCLLMFLFFHSPLSGALWPCAPLIAREFESIPITVAIVALHLAPNGTPLAAVARSGVRCPVARRRVAVSYRHMYATGVVHTVLGWYAVRARSVISYSTTIRPSTAYNVLQYLHEDRRPGPDSRRDTSVLRSRERLDHFTFRWFRLFKRLPTTRAQICTDGPLVQAFHVKAVPTH